MIGVDSNERLFRNDFHSFVGCECLVVYLKSKQNKNEKKKLKKNWKIIFEIFHVIKDCVVFWCRQKNVTQNGVCKFVSIVMYEKYWYKYIFFLKQSGWSVLEQNISSDTTGRVYETRLELLSMWNFETDLNFIGRIEMCLCLAIRF